MALAYPKVVLLRSTLSLSFTAVSDNTRPASSKTFQDFGFLFDVNQTVTIASNPSLSKKSGNHEQKLQKYMWVGTERTNSFSPSHICVSPGFGSSIRTISPWEFKLAMFRYKAGKKL